MTIAAGTGWTARSCPQTVRLSDPLSASRSASTTSSLAKSTLVWGDRRQDLFHFLVALPGAGLVAPVAAPSQRCAVEPVITPARIRASGKEMPNAVGATAVRRLVQGRRPVSIDSVYGCLGAQQLIDDIQPTVLGGHRLVVRPGWGVLN